MEFDTEDPLPYMPPNDPWEELEVSEPTEGYLTLYYCEDEISKYPVREVTKVNDNKSDPNLETMSYGMCSTCTRDIRSGLVKNGRPYIFFCTNYKGQRYLTGYYHIGWHALGPPLLSNLQNGTIQDDYRLVADEMKFVYPAFSFEEVAEKCDFEDILSGFRKKLVSPDEVSKILSLFDEHEDASKDYIREIERLESINKRYHEYRYPTWKREAGFAWNNVEDYVLTDTGWDYNDLKDEIESIQTASVSEWVCMSCEYEFENEAPLKVCPECGKIGALLPEEVQRNLN